MATQSITVSFTKQQADAIRLLAAYGARSASNIVREAMDVYLREKDVQRMLTIQRERQKNAISIR